MNGRPKRYRVGELRPSQLMSMFGVGSVVDLPHLSVMVMGLDDWNRADMQILNEERLLAAVRRTLGDQVKELRVAPVPEDDGAGIPGLPDASDLIGVPVVAYPRWFRCSSCSYLGPLAAGLFKIKTNSYRPEETRYAHENCARSTGRPPTAIPARFLVACPAGHIDDFPWLEFVHLTGAGCKGRLRMAEIGNSGEASDILIVCEACQTQRSMAQAFGEEGRKNLGRCKGTRFHLRDVDPEPCREKPRAIMLGSSNTWFPEVLTVLSVPRSADELAQAVEDRWAEIGDAADESELRGTLKALQKMAKLGELSKFDPGALWAAIQRRKNAAAAQLDEGPPGLKLPEWQVLSAPARAPASADFKLREEPVPVRYARWLERVVLAERLREVRALIGFTRIEAPGELSDGDPSKPEGRVPLCRGDAEWVPACQVLGEGIFLQFREPAILEWCDRLADREARFREAHRRWRENRKLEPPAAGFPGMRFVLLHSLAHALIRQLALECGYGASSLRERIYSLEPEDEDGPMAGVLLYTAAPDSEGTLGGLVELGRMENLERHLDGALRELALCASDPLCAEHQPGSEESDSLHGAACHACQFVGETSCERGNKYLDRSLLVPTLEHDEMAFFASLEEGDE